MFLSKSNRDSVNSVNLYIVFWGWWVFFLFCGFFCLFLCVFFFLKQTFRIRSVYKQSIEELGSSGFLFHHLSIPCTFFAYLKESCWL